MNECDLISTKPLKTILFVDDDALLRRVGERILKRLGYDVHLAGSGLEACAIYEKEKDTIDLVLLDLSMPGMDGEDTFLKLCEINSNVRVIFSTGFDKENRVDVLMKKGALGFVKKPFDLNLLGEKLQTTQAATQKKEPVA